MTVRCLGPRFIVMTAALLVMCAFAGAHAVAQAPTQASPPVASNPVKPDASQQAVELIKLTAGRSTVLITDFDITRRRTNHRLYPIQRM